MKVAIWSIDWHIYFYIFFFGWLWEFCVGFTPCFGPKADLYFTHTDSWHIMTAEYQGFGISGFIQCERDVTCDVIRYDDMLMLFPKERNNNG